MTLNGIIIGHGSSGVVMQYGNYAPFVAVKRIFIYSVRIKKYTERELKALEILSHSNIVKFYGHDEKTFDGCEFLMTYMEFCERYSLKHVLDDPTVVYNLKTVFGWTEHLASALLCLKQNQIVHRDIKPENVFVTKSFILKLGDFGLGKDLEMGSSMSFVGTERYMSPEASGHFGKAKSIYKSDLYAMGLVLWEMVERKRVFSPEYESLGIHAIFNDLQEGRYPPTNCDAKLKDLILQCIKFDHWLRPDIEDFIKEIVRLNRNYNEEMFKPITRISQRSVQKPNSIRKEQTKKRDLLQKELVDKLNQKQIAWINSGYTFDNPVEHETYLDEQEQSTPFMNKSLNDAISMLKSLAIRQDDTKLLEMFERRIQNFSKFSDDYIFCNDKYPNFPPMIDQELLDYLSEQKYERYFVLNIKSALEMCEQCFRNDFRTWLIETLDALRWYIRANREPRDYLLKAIEQIHSIIDRISDNPFYIKWLVVNSYKTYISGRSIRFLLSRKRNDFRTERLLYLHKGLHIESCLNDLQDTLEYLLKDTNINHAILKHYLQRYQPRDCVFPFRAYRFEWGKRVDECEEIRMSNIDPESLADYESLRQAYECALKILVAHSNGKENPLNGLAIQIKSCLLKLKKPRKCPNYFLFHARELKDDESQNVNILCINPKEENPFVLGDDLISRWKKTENGFSPPYAIIRVDLLIDCLSELPLKNKSSCFLM